MDKGLSSRSLQRAKKTVPSDSSDVLIPLVNSIGSFHKTPRLCYNRAKAGVLTACAAESTGSFPE